MQRLTLLACSAVAIGLSPSTLAAQSAQRFAVQASVLGTSIYVGTAGAIGGIGFEPQLRVNRVLQAEGRGTLSLGLGGQWTQHESGPDELKIAGIFVEPRWVAPSAIGGFYPYAAGRIALLRQTSNFGSGSNGSAFGLGGGVAYPLSSIVNIDVGVALLRQRFGDFTRNIDGATREFRAFNTYAAKAGLSIGFPKS